MINVELAEKRVTKLVTPPAAGTAMSARERLVNLFDTDSFIEIGSEIRHRQTDFGLAANRPAGDGVITGFGTISGHRVYAFSQDKSAFGGALGEAHAAKIMRVQDLALEHGTPIVCLNDSGGARIQEGIDALAGYAGIFRRHVLASGRIPQISIIHGPCAGGAAYGPSLTDFIIMVKEKSTMFLTGPKVVEAVCKEKVSAEDLGGSKLHSEKTGLSHFVAASDEDAFVTVRKLIRILREPMAPGSAPAPVDPSVHVPANARQVYDVRKVIESIVDRNSFIEVQAKFAASLSVGFARMNGMAVGIVANNPMRLGGVLDSESARKGARFVQMCDRYRLPIITLVDVPGFLPGTVQEKANVIGNGSKLLFAYCQATVPKISVVMRKAYGGAYIVMNSKGIGADFYFAWPQAELAVMGKRGAAEILFRKEIASALNPEDVLLIKEEEYARKMLNVQKAAEHGHVDAIIHPRETRSVILSTLYGMKAKHSIGSGNIQL